MMTRSCLFFPFAVMLLSMALGQEKVSEDKPVPVVTKEQPMSFWMEKKLEYSKQILEALTAGNYEGIESNSEQMRLLGKIEGFVRRRSRSYSSHLQSFDLATRELTRQAREKNIEGATLAFHQLTTSCVACHRTIREISLSPEVDSSKPYPSRK
ncbi:MAG: hypothetical protein SGI77_01150 [Pirellulaceae bacterium]|nr:hypothetical protein [Pirellulaceae bacterium]